MQEIIERETLAFREKIALSKLEEARALVRTRDLEYRQARFDLDIRYGRPHETRVTGAPGND